MIVLGIESSHDDTSIAIVQDDFVIFNYKISQINIHKVYGGTIPEIASREHFNNFYILLNKLLNSEHKQILNQIDYIAYTENPGLIGALQMGKLFAFALSKALNKPIKGINHLDGHIYSVLLTNNKNETKKIIYPALALVASGGHTNLYLLKSKEEKKLIGNTLDDAIGEVFDKVGRTLELGFPGGPIIDKIFHSLKNKKNIPIIKLNTPKTKNLFDFSYSGFKTQIINLIKNNESINKKHVAYWFQKTIIDYTCLIIQKAINKFLPKTLILSGGVSANKYLRSCFLKMHFNVLIPDFEFSTDNGAMIAKALIESL